MCIKCDGYSDEEIMRGIDLAIRVEGFFVQGVAEDPDTPGGWSYTIGLTDFDLPELVVMDLPLSVSVGLLTSVAARLITGHELAVVASDLDCALGPIHLDHLDRDLILVWLEYYAEMRADCLPSRAQFLQLVPGPTHRCSCGDVAITDLSRSC